MALISDSWLIDVVITSSVFVFAVYLYLRSVFSYWKERNIPYAKVTDCFKTSMLTLLKIKSNPDLIKELYYLKSGESFFGFYQFTKPALMIRDPKLIERIMIKDFSHFEDRGLPMDTENEPLTMNLVNLKGDKWRSLRHKLTPTFTSGKLKGMFEQMSNCGENLMGTIEKYTETGETVDTKDICFLFSTDVIASCAFGLQIKSGSAEGEQFKEMVNKATGNASIYRLILSMMFPKIARLLGITIIPPDVTEYFMNITKATVKNRLENKIHREDFLQLLLSLKARDEAGETTDFAIDSIDKEDIQLKYLDRKAPTNNNFKLTDELIAAQSFIFLAAGSDSTSTTMSVAMHYIASHAEVQARLQEEVDEVLARHKGVWSYQALKEMTYLDQILQESMRLFPIAHLHMRTCTSPYRMPNSDLVVEKGIQIIISTIGLHMDPAYHPNPEQFDPDRFYGNNFKPSPTFMPFGDGPRICIAMRFAILEMKTMIAKIMSKYSMVSSPTTITPLQYDPKAFNNRPLGSVWVNFTKRHL